VSRIRKYFNAVLRIVDHLLKRIPTIRTVVLESYTFMLPVQLRLAALFTFRARVELGLRQRYGRMNVSE
jgi:hypothetical protein